MGISAIVLLAVTAFFAIRGFFNGFLGSLARTVSFIGAYAAAFVFGKQATELVRQHTTLDGMAAYLAGGIGVFVLAMVVLRVIFWIIIKLTPNADQRLSSTSRFAGMIVGGIVGAAIGFLLVYTFGIYTAARDLSNENIQAKPEDKVNQAAKFVVSKTAAGIMSLTTDNKNTVKMSEAFIAAPVESVDRINRVTHNSDLQALLKDERSQRLMKKGDIDALMQVPEFNRLMNDEDMKQLLSDSGMDISQKDSAQQTAKKIAFGWQQIQSMQDDPRVRAIINDPEFKQQMQADNKLPLLMNPKLNTLAEIIFVEGGNKFALVQADSEVTIRDVQQGAGAVVDQDEDGNANDKAIYRWTDENGRVHYSDKPVTNR